MKERTIVVPVRVWEMTWEGLRIRSDNERESACIWGGVRSDEREDVHQVHFIDDLPGVSRGRLSHRTSREATQMLFGQLRELGQGIVVDIHTHPGSWVRLSETDAAHPIEYRIGLLAMVLPEFANGAALLSRAGVHSYLGNGEWDELSAGEARKRILIK